MRAAVIDSAGDVRVEDQVRELDDITATFAAHGGRGTGQEQYG